MDLKKLQAMYGLKWNPFAREIPMEALQKNQHIDHFGWRVENLVMDGGFALITGEPGSGKSAALRMTAARLSGIRDVVVCEFSRPQSSIADFYREMGTLFDIDIRSSNRFGGHKALRGKWRSHIQSTLFRPILTLDEAQEAHPQLLTELRLLSSENFDTRVLITVVLAGDRRLVEKLKSPELMPIHSRIRTKLTLAPYSREELIRFLAKSLELAGNPSLMTEDLMETLAEHSVGNPRAMMTLADELLSDAVRLGLNQLDTKLYLEHTSHKETQPDVNQPDRTDSPGLIRRPTQTTTETRDRRRRT